MSFWTRTEEQRNDDHNETMRFLSRQNLALQAEIAKLYKEMVEIEKRRDWREKRLFVIAVISIFGSLVALSLSWLSFWVSCSPK